MNSILTSITEHVSGVILFLAALTLLVAAVALRALTASSSIKRRFRDLLDGTRGENLETLLHDHLSERLKMQGEMQALESRVRELEGKMRRTKRYLGVVRYDAFEDVGGEQSFALALFDDNGDGAVLTSLVGRTDCRVYCKPLSEGRSDRNLSTEETKAVQAAAESPRAQRT